MALFWNGSEYQNVVVNGTAYDNVFVDGIQVIGGTTPPPDETWRDNEYAPAQFLYDPAFKGVCIDGFDDTTWDVVYGADYLDVTCLTSGRIVSIGGYWPQFLQMDVQMDIDPLDNTEVKLGTAENTNSSGEIVEVTVTTAGTYSFTVQRGGGPHDAFVSLDTNGSGTPFRVSNVSIKPSQEQTFTYDDSTNLVHDVFSGVRGPFNGANYTYTFENEILDLTVNANDPSDPGTLRFDVSDTAPVTDIGWVMIITSLDESTLDGRLYFPKFAITCIPLHQNGQIIGGHVPDLTTYRDLLIANDCAVGGTGRFKIEMFPLTSVPAIIQPTGGNNGD